jgi:hypothetical protein
MKFWPYLECALELEDELDEELELEEELPLRCSALISIALILLAVALFLSTA